MEMKLKVGADPEMFVHLGGFGFVSPHDFFPGSKKEPYAVQAGALQVDGLAAEINVLPATTREDFVNNFNTVYAAAQSFLKPKMSFARIPAVQFRDSYYKELPESLKEVGCDPDYCAWEGGKRNPTPVLQENLRVAGGHLHLGFGEDFNSNDLLYQTFCCDLAKQLDCLIGTWDTAFETDGRRKRSYGTAGALRYKPYGFEYRTPSNRWTQNAHSTGLMFDLVQKAFRDYNNGIRYFDKYTDVRRVINESERETARKIHYAIFNG